ncbi:MAG TPA: metalloregulator ArsR/SmtB family transcription factor [Candidatus Binataceae bacterium]|nr:metalloregulator ArsR/SmtB family transcription factor [Candidatus Binataceae bacterium]
MKANRGAGPRGIATAIPPAALELVAARFRALGEPLRLRMLQSLEGREMSVSALAGMVGSTQPNISKHLRVLQEVGLVRRRQQGVTAYYAIADETVFELCELVCAGVRDRLESQVGALGSSGLSRPRSSGSMRRRRALRPPA